jgi:hypothetical protein
MYVRGYWQGSENGRVVTIGVFVVYIDTGSSMLIILSKSRDLADENKKILTEWKWFETTYYFMSGKSTNKPKG